MVSNDTSFSSFYPLPQLIVTANGYYLNSILVQTHIDVKILPRKCNDIAHILIFDGFWKCLLLSCNINDDGYTIPLPKGIHCSNDFESYAYDYLTVTPGY